MAVDEEILLLDRLGFGHVAVRVNVLCGLKCAVGIVLAHFVQLPLVILHFLHELPNVGQGRTGLLLGQTGGSQPAGRGRLIR